MCTDTGVSNSKEARGRSLFTHRQIGSTCVVALSDYTPEALLLLLSNPCAFARACRFVQDGQDLNRLALVMFEKPDRKPGQPFNGLDRPKGLPLSVCI